MARTKGPIRSSKRRNKFEGSDKLGHMDYKTRLKLQRFIDVRYISAAKILTWWRRWRKSNNGDLANAPSHNMIKIKGINNVDERMDQYQSWKRTARYCWRCVIPAAKILTWWRRWKTSSKSKDTAAVSPKVKIILGYKQRVYLNGSTHQYPCIKYFRLYYPKDIRNNTNKLEIDTNVNKNAQQNEIHHLNTVCCKKLLSKENIIQNHLHRSTTLKFTGLITNKDRVDDIYNEKSTSETVPFVVDTSDGKNLPPDVQTNQQNNTGILSNYYEQHDIRNNDNNFFDEKAKPDVLYYVNTNTKNAQQNEIHHVNTVCCKKLLSKENIIQNHLHRSTTLKFTGLITNKDRVDDIYNEKSTSETVPFVVDTSDGKNLPPDVQTNQQNNNEQKIEIHHLSTLPTRDNFVHCNHNLLSYKTMVDTNPLRGNSKSSNFGKPMDCSQHFHRVCRAGSGPTFACRVLACGGA